MSWFDIFVILAGASIGALVLSTASEDNDTTFYKLMIFFIGGVLGACVGVLVSLVL